MMSSVPIYIILQQNSGSYALKRIIALTIQDFIHMENG